MHASVENEPLWRLERVSLAPARLCEVSLEIRPGVTAIIGWSGAGKTSLLNLFVGFEQAERGRLVRAKIESRGQAVRAPIAWVPQNAGLWPHCTAREHIEIAAGTSDGAADWLAAFDLSAKAGARPGELSEGEQSRLAVARALATRAPVLVLDEPLAHVDPARSGDYWRVIREHVARTGASLVFSSHTPETVLGEAERVVCLREGRVIHQGAVLDLYHRPPTPELMSFLGSGNWLAPDEARLWLGAPINAARCFRPEEITIRSATDGPLVVITERFMGSHAECELRHEPTGRVQVFVHRPNGARLRAGNRATIEIA